MKKPNPFLISVTLAPPGAKSPPATITANKVGLFAGMPGGNTRLRDLGAWLFTTELAAIEDYWFDVTGDQPLVAVFQREGIRTYVAYNPQPQSKTVSFSDGLTLDCKGRSISRWTRKAGSQP